jgi:3-oxoacyl-[acyl-carrier protein] reductase
VEKQMARSVLGELSGRVAVVTGAARGIGRAVAETLAGRGASVLVNYARNSEAATQVVHGIRSAGGQAEALELRLQDAMTAKGLFDAALNLWQRVDILVLNAGVARFGPMTQFSEEDFDQMFASNAKAPFFAMQQAATRMSEGGRIVSISASLTGVGYDNTALYAGTKGALEQFTLAAAKELGKRGITCNCVSPGATDTDLYRGLAPEAAQQAAKQRSPFKRLGDPREIAEVVAFLASDAGRWVSGQNIRVNGAALW